MQPSESMDGSSNLDTAEMHGQEAAKYIKEHKIMELFENITSALVYERPDDPKEFMKGYIEQLLKAKSDPDEVDPPSFFDESNLKSVFGMLDITKKGYISREQYLHAMCNLGVKKFNQNPAGSEFNKISQETFVREVKIALRSASATFVDF